MSGINTAMSLIAGAGDSKSFSMEAIIHAKSGNFDEARVCIEKAKAAMVETHDVQMELIRNEMKGDGEGVSLLMVHAQDHLTSAMLMRDMALEFIELYERLAKK